MTLGELRDEVRDAVLEKASDTGLIPDTASLDRWINRANRDVYRQAVEWNPTPWIERSADVAYAAPLSFAAIAGPGKPVRSVHLVRAKLGSDYYAVDPLEEGALDFVGYEPASGGGGLLPSRWYVEGRALWLTPPPVGPTELRVSFVREAAAMAAPADPALGGVLGDHHDLVALTAAQLLYRKDEMLVTPWDKDVEKGLRDLRSALARNQGQRTRRVRAASHFPTVRRRR